MLNKLSLIGLPKPFQRQYLAYCLLHWVSRVQVTILSLRGGKKLVVACLRLVFYKCRQVRHHSDWLKYCLGVCLFEMSTLLKLIQSLLLSTSVSKYYWAEAMLTAVLLSNITTSSVTANMSTYSHLHRHSFDYSLPHTFGCFCFFLLPSYEQDKLSPKTKKCIFLGYSFTYKGYQCYDPTTIRLRIARHLSFF